MLSIPIPIFLELKWIINMLMAQLAACISLRLRQAFRKTALRRPCGVCKWKSATSASLCWQPPACKMHSCSSETLMSFGHRQTNFWNLWLIPWRSRGSAQFCSFWTPQTVVFVPEGMGWISFSNSLDGHSDLSASSNPIKAASSFSTSTFMSSLVKSSSCSILIS